MKTKEPKQHDLSWCTPLFVNKRRKHTDMNWLTSTTTMIIGGLLGILMLIGFIWWNMPTETLTDQKLEDTERAALAEMMDFCFPNKLQYKVNGYKGKTCNMWKLAWAQTVVDNNNSLISYQGQ